MSLHGAAAGICFNPRTREECDTGDLCGDDTPRGFNPRTREECDYAVTYNDYKSGEFQSTHP